MAIYETINLGFSNEKYEKEMKKAIEKFKLNEDYEEYELLKLERRKKDKKLIARYKHSCGCEFHLVQSKFNNDHSRCPDCSQNKKITYEEIKKVVEDETDFEYKLLSDDFKCVRDMIKIKHDVPECGKEYTVAIRKFKEGNRCNCNRKRIYKERTEMTDEKYTKRIEEMTNGEYIKTGIYVNHNTPFKVKHIKCGYEWDICGYDFVYNGHRCPKCFRKRSNMENELVDFIKQYYPDVETNYRPDFLKGKEIDIFIKELSIGIEFNGLYWHSEEGSRGKCNKDFHLNKLELCNKNMIRLIYIDEEEWRDKTEIVKSKLRHILQRNTNEKIYARKCTIQEIDSKTRCNFLNKHHIQGSDRANISLGLFHDKELVSVISFVKPRKALNGNTNKYDYELSRFASHIDYNVIGAFSKLLSYFSKNYEFKKLITYADRNWSIGNLYSKNGWVELKSSSPSYSYINKNNKLLKKEFRFKYRKQRLKELFPDIYNENKSEREIMNEAGYLRYWNCGNLVFEYTKK